jgi:hypothetical protein
MRGLRFSGGTSDALVASGMVVDPELIDRRDIPIGFFVVRQITTFFEQDELDFRAHVWAVAVRPYHS